MQSLAILKPEPTDNDTRNRTVQVRFLRTSMFSDPAVARRASTYLSPPELELWRRLRGSPARRDYLAAHTLVRVFLSEYLGLNSEQVRISYSLYGCPVLIGTPDAGEVQFSISHADGVALCAVSSSTHIGVDIESMRNLGPDPLAPAELICSPEEIRTLRRLHGEEQRRHLLALWTLKEAMSKAMGLGFFVPFQEFTLGRNGVGRWSVRPVAKTGFECSTWSLTLSHLSPSHIAAVAFPARQDGPVPIRVEEYEYGTLSHRAR